MIKRGCKKGLSTINIILIVAILVLIASAVIWIVIRNAIYERNSERIDTSNLDLKISQVEKINDSTLNVTLKRNAGEGEFVALSFAVDDGTTTEVIRINTSIQENESQSFSLNFIILNASKIDKISVTPIILDEENEEVAGNLEDEYITPNTCSNYCPTGAQCGTNSCGMKCGNGCASNYICLNYKCIRQTSSGGGGGGGSSTCTDTCASLGHDCGTQTVCSNSVNCGSCSTGHVCSLGICIEEGTCTDTCSSLGYQCGTPTICGNATACGNCSLANSVSACNASYKCVISSCNSGYGNCDSNVTNGCETILGTNSNCASCGNACSSGYNCSTNKTCMAIPCTDNCTSLGYQCGTHTVCGSSTNCGTCGTGYNCNSNGTCMINPPSPPATGAIIADHNAARDFDDIPSCWIEEAKEMFSVTYHHTSHGSQIPSGIWYLETYVNSSLYAYSDSVVDGSLFFMDHYDTDLGNGNWPQITRSDLDSTPSLNNAMWSWCGQVSGYTTYSAMNSWYLAPAESIVNDYEIDFVYMTGHLDGTGPTGNVYTANNLIRQHVEDINGTLFDFADIESYDPDGNYYPSESDACGWCTTWCTNHPEQCTNLPSCAHSHGFNCVQKGRAYWWLMARMSGWDGTPSDPCP